MKALHAGVQKRFALLCVETEKRLFAAGNERPDAKAFFARNAKSSALAGLFAWLLAGLYLKSAVLGLGAMLAAGALAFVFLSFVEPAGAGKRRSQLVESQLPFALNDFAVELSLGLAFEKCAENVSNRNYGIVSREFSRLLAETRHKGKGMRNALFDLGNRFSSRSLRRACAQLAFAYNSGSPAESAGAIRRVSSEILSRQRAQAKEFSAKLAMLSLVFVVVSAIVPAMFLVFVIVGSAFLKVSFSPMQVLLACIAGFPLLDMAVFLFVKSQAPAFMQ
ncbi:MAG: type II secretion system F family protein [Candidatus Diapherotrites archaeon]|nr:type II secretion system F family protein [Candidatus Diapherotrites archaeon]